MNKFITYAFRLIVLVTTICSDSVLAQTFEEYKKQKEAEFKRKEDRYKREFKEYRDRINAEFAEYMRQAWPEYKSTPAEPAPDFPELPKPVIDDPDTPPSNDPIPFDEVKTVPKPDQPVTPKPDTPTPVEPAKPTKSVFTFTFYGAKCEMPLENRHRFTLKNATEDAVADGWMVLSSDEYQPVVSQCLYYRNKLHLPDWGYWRFVEQMTTAFFPQSKLNEARLMQMYILTQSEYKVRIARAGKTLVLLLPSKHMIYNYAVLNVDGSLYYVIDQSVKQSSFHVFNREFPKERDFSLRMTEPPTLPVDKDLPRYLQSTHDKELAVEIALNRNLINFYNEYPLSPHWDIYANASLSKLAKEQLYPVLRTAIAGKNKATAANILLHFVQTAFEYESDSIQFGYGRSFFADETLYYPYSDCEDRAILYSILVRELLGLDVVLLHYPKHLATAVRFDTKVEGESIMIDNRHYTVCDPTYRHADIGQVMPVYKQNKPNVIRIQ